MLQDFLFPYHASGMMAWDGDYSYLYDQFDPKFMSMRGGDGEYIRKRVKADTFQNLFPEKIVSKKVHSLEERQKASVICYHGKPRPHEVNWSI
jgi:hypothetical protein